MDLVILKVFQIALVVGLCLSDSKPDLQRCWCGQGHKQASSGSFRSTSFALNYLVKETEPYSRNAVTGIGHRR